MQRQKPSLVDIFWMTGCLIPLLAIVVLIVRAVWIIATMEGGAGLLGRYMGGGAFCGVALAALNLFWVREELYQRRVNLLTGERTPWQLVRTSLTGPIGRFMSSMVIGAVIGLIAAVFKTW